MSAASQAMPLTLQEQLKIGMEVEKLHAAAETLKKASATEGEEEARCQALLTTVRSYRRLYRLAGEPHEDRVPTTNPRDLGRWDPADLEAYAANLEKDFAKIEAAAGWVNMKWPKAEILTGQVNGKAARYDFKYESGGDQLSFTLTATGPGSALGGTDTGSATAEDRTGDISEASAGTRSFMSAENAGSIDESTVTITDASGKTMHLLVKGDAFKSRCYRGIRYLRRTDGYA